MKIRLNFARAFWVLVATFILLGCQSSRVQKQVGSGPDNQGSTFVSVDGQRFFKDGKPYYFVGTNFWYGAYLGASEQGRERLVRELDQLKSLGVTNLRILAASEQSDLMMSVSPAIVTAPGVYNEELLQGLDFTLDELAKRDMQAVLYLNNFWQWSGGMAQYMSWLTGAPAFDPDKTGDWNGFMQNSASFYRSEKAQSWYRELIKTLVERVNTVNGKIYSEDKSIMSWQLANEPRPGSDEHSKPYYEHYKNWIKETASFIKSLDSNHLVSTGSEGAMGSARDLNLYIAAHDIPEVDYLTFHMWPKNWSWFDIKNAEETYSEALVKSKAYMLQHIEVAKDLDKPTVLEEFGIERDGGDYTIDSTTSSRDRFYKEIYRFIEHHAKLGGPIAGSNFWTWGGEGRAQHSDLIWRSGDPFTGDPPQEAQGLNSVFDEDKSTLEVIYEHAEAMNRIR